MKVYGHTVDDNAINLVFSEVTGNTNFTTREVELRLSAKGIHKDACYRAADRLVQKWRRQGKIFYDKGNQCWRDIKYYEAIYG